eukprot:CAMPEP_0177235324 /NCGR_PEP_ID=MMETSP0367-20130122/44868_1 /TAXON_ID=447022 ORGANISM="Scrippsiella hangoei-like, Strain SHHI-4" /NCGR_SAMPLE_ID=MMETSP0367 /ASSEMBLY_ACC=CAM_ASM_000362 /LENGTH=528 /DNA_ID=CAMNT_0018686175 /DNA_START=44 /DNA_END=1627 /DNA_ORIENTATION=-
MVQVRSSRDDVLTSVVEEKGAIDHTVPTQKVSASVPKIPMEIGTPSIQAPPGLLFRPGSQPTPSQQDMRHCGIDDDSFAMMLRSAPLPAGLCADLVKLGHLKDAIYLAVESMYFDRIVPALGELRGRLRGCGWQPSDFSCLLQICAHSPKTYELVPPTGEHPPQVLLRSTPPWFKGWCEDDEIHDPFSETVWQEFKTVLAGAAKEPKGGVVRMAEALRKMQLPTHMQCLSLGELRHLIVLALSPQKGLLTYDPLNGGRFLTHAGNHQTCHDKPAEDADSKNGVQVVQAQKDEAPPTALNGVKRAFHNADRDKNGVAKESVKATKPLESQVDVSHDGARCNECMPPLAHVGESVSHNGLACGGDGNRSSALMAASIDDGGSVVQDVGELLGAFNLQTLAMEYYLHVAALQHCIQSFYFLRRSGLCRKGSSTTAGVPRSASSQHSSARSIRSSSSSSRQRAASHCASTCARLPPRAGTSASGPPRRPWSTPAGVPTASAAARLSEGQAMMPVFPLLSQRAARRSILRSRV